MTKSDKLAQALKYIIDSITKIEVQTLCSFEDFQKNQILVTSTLFYLEKLSDATMHIPSDIKTIYKQIPWRQIKGFRNILAHQYLEGYDYEVIWNTLKTDLPLLKKVISEIVELKYNKT